MTEAAEHTQNPIKNKKLKKKKIRVSLMEEQMKLNRRTNGNCVVPLTSPLRMFSIGMCVYKATGHVSCNCEM